MNALERTWPVPGTVVTVDGPIDPALVGLTSIHEHLLMDMTGWPRAPDEGDDGFANLPVTLESIGRLRRDTWRLNLDNYRLDDPALAAQELSAFRIAGGGTVVDQTTLGLAPRPLELRRIAREADVHVVAGCGTYLAALLPAPVRSMRASTLAGWLLDQVTLGLDGTDVRPGLIGELGTSEQVEPVEWRALDAAAEVQQRTGLAVSVHTHPWARHGVAIARRLLDRGVPPGRIVIGHLDNAPIDAPYHMELAAMGVWLAYDGFGKEWYVDDRRSWYPRDYERLAGIRSLIASGHLSQVVVGGDVCLKIQLARYGGWGYAHLPRNVRRLMETMGFTATEAQTLLVDNPCRLLTVAPQVAV